MTASTAAHVPRPSQKPSNASVRRIGHFFHRNPGDNYSSLHSHNLLHTNWNASLPRRRLLTRLLHHLDPLDQDLSSLYRSPHLPVECDPGATHARGSLQGHMKAEAIDGGRRRLLGVDAGKFPNKKDERILVVGVHVLDNFGIESAAGRVGSPDIRRQIPNPSPRSPQRNKCPRCPCGKKKSPQNPPSSSYWHGVLDRGCERHLRYGHYNPHQGDSWMTRANHRRRHPASRASSRGRLPSSSAYALPSCL